MDFNKIRSFCKYFRIAIGLILIAIGTYFMLTTTDSSLWWFLGVLPLVAGLVNFCPLCIITKKCDVEK